jgi:hypothetical protein
MPAYAKTPSNGHPMAAHTLQRLRTIKSCADAFNGHTLTGFYGGFRPERRTFFMAGQAMPV